MAAQEGELTLFAPCSDGRHHSNPSIWCGEAFWHLQNLQQHVVTIPWAEWVTTWYLNGGSCSSNSDGDGCSGGDGDARGRMAEGKQGSARGA